MKTAMRIDVERVYRAKTSSVSATATGNSWRMPAGPEVLVSEEFRSHSR
jgi:hypothetical protein